MIGGFSFKGVQASSLGILVAGRTRVIKSTNRVVEYTVPGRDGVVRYDNGTSGTFDLAVPIVAKEYDYEVDGVTYHKSIREICRDIGYFLQGSGALIFDDEPTKQYNAMAVNEVPVSEIAEFGQAEIVFRCQPFAQATTYTQHNDLEANIPASEQLSVVGTHKTPCIINITAHSSFSGLTITYTKGED